MTKAIQIGGPRDGAVAWFTSSEDIPEVRSGGIRRGGKYRAVYRLKGDIEPIAIYTFVGWARVDIPLDDL